MIADYKSKGCLAAYADVIRLRDSLDKTGADWLKQMYLSMLADYLKQAQHYPIHEVFNRVPAAIINGMRNAARELNIDYMFASMPHRVSA